MIMRHCCLATLVVSSNHACVQATAVTHVVLKLSQLPILQRMPVWWRWYGYLEPGGLDTVRCDWQPAGGRGHADRRERAEPARERVHTEHVRVQTATALWYCALILLGFSIAFWFVVAGAQRCFAFTCVCTYMPAVACTAPFASSQGLPVSAREHHVHATLCMAVLLWESKML